MTLMMEWELRRFEKKRDEMVSIVKSGDVNKVLKAVSFRKNKTDGLGNTFLHLTASHGTVEMVKELLEKGLDLHKMNDRNQDALDIALAEARSEMVEFLLSKGAKVDKKDFQGESRLLRYSNYRVDSIGMGDSIKALIKYGADLNEVSKYRRTALHLAANAGLSDVVQVLVEAGADIHQKDENGQTPLHLSSYMPRPAVVKYLLSVGANPNERDIKRRTPLHLVMMNGFSQWREVAELLIDGGADVDAKDERLKTPLITICERRQKSSKCAEFLLKAGASVNERDMEGKSVLEHAMYHSQWGKDSLEILVKHGANFDVADQGNSLLMFAIWYGWDDLVNLLFEKGANPNKTLKNGKSALSYAIERGRLKYIPLFEKHKSRLDEVQMKLLREHLSGELAIKMEEEKKEKEKNAPIEIGKYLARIWGVSPEDKIVVDLLESGKIEAALEIMMARYVQEEPEKRGLFGRKRFRAF